MAPDIDTAKHLARKYARLDASELLRVMIKDEFLGRIAVTSSFGIEAAALLCIVAKVDACVPVVFLDTGLLFDETLAYRDTIAKHLGLKDVRSVKPDPEDIVNYDVDKEGNVENTETCCYLRKVLPLGKALAGFDAWITGRKRFHGGERGSLQAIEFVNGHIKINPLVEWSQERINDLYKEHNLPRHPLADAGYASVGCRPCTSRTNSGDDVRAGRWADMEKTECGIHNAPWFGEGI